MFKITKTAYLGKGWTGTRYDDDAATIQNRRQGERIELSPTSVATLRAALNAKTKQTDAP